MIDPVASGLVALLLLGVLYEQTFRRLGRRQPVPGRMIDVGGYCLHASESGRGDLTVVILHGAGDSSHSWMHVQKQVSEFAHVVAFDRAGLGSSEPRPAHDPSGSVRELHTLLTALGCQGRYVLVGHSLGGLIARLYALRYSDEVAGMVLIDSTHEFLKDDPKFRRAFAASRVLLKAFRLTSPIGLPRFMGQVLRWMPMYRERSFFMSQISLEERQ